MLMGHAEGLSKPSSKKDLLLANPVSEFDGDEEADTPGQILYVASFEELGEKRYVLKKDIASRKLYITPNEIVYKVSRPSFVPFWGFIKIERHVPLALVIDIIIEQGWLQSLFRIHTIRVESIARGIAAPVDELQVYGVYNPDLMRKVIVAEAGKAIQNVSRGLRSTLQTGEGEGVARMESLTESSAILRSPSSSRTRKVVASPHHASAEYRVGLSPDILQKLDEVNKSVKKIESLMEKPESSPRSSAKRSLISAFGD